MATNGTRTRPSASHARRMSSDGANTIRAVGTNVILGGGPPDRTAIELPLVEGVGDAINVATKRINDIGEEVRTLADRLLGSDTAEGVGLEEPAVTGQAYTALQQTRFLAAAISSLEHEIRRLHRL